MRELKILGVVVAFTLITYWGVEPFAHSQMHPHVEPADYSFSDLEGTKAKGNSESGKALVEANCTACHSIEKVGFPPLMDDATNSATYGVVPPDLSTAGLIYDDNYLAAFIKNPAKAAKVEHKFQDGKSHPMPNYDWMSDQEIADMVEYFNSIAPSEMSNKEVFVDACGRCHNMKYAGIESRTTAEAIKSYMGTTPPDLSQYIRSRSKNYLHEFINDPQKHIEGTAMPRTGLTEDSETQVIAYMEEVGDSKKEERESLGVKVLLYLVVLAVFAWLWKIKIWKEVH